MAEHADYSYLKTRAQKLLPIVRRQARRAYVVELTGTPKAGKTTSLGILHAFFKACGYRVQLQKERAGDCPLPMKGHFFFNAWTTSTMLAEVVAAVETNVDLILLDRAFFDALIWLELQLRRGQVSEDESRTFASFVLLERWRSLVDITTVMTAVPTVALERENKNAIVPRTGSIMNSAALQEFNDVLRTVRERHANDFTFLEVDSSSTTVDVVELNADLAGRLLDSLEDWADPPVAVIERKQVEELFGDEVLIRGDKLAPAWAKLSAGARPMKRSTAEESVDVVQLVGCGVCLSENSAFVLERSAADEKAESYGPYTLWKGCHIEMRSGEPPPIDVAARSVVGRLESDLHLKQIAKPEPIALAWDRNARSESRHLGFLFLLKISDKQIIKSLEVKEFRKSSRGHTLVGRLANREELLSSIDKFEPWSRALVEGNIVP